MPNKHPNKNKASEIANKAQITRSQMRVNVFWDHANLWIKKLPLYNIDKQFCKFLCPTAYVHCCRIFANTICAHFGSVDVETSLANSDIGVQIDFSHKETIFFSF